MDNVTTLDNVIINGQHDRHEPRDHVNVHDQKLNTKDHERSKKPSKPRTPEVDGKTQKRQSL